MMRLRLIAAAILLLSLGAVRAGAQAQPYVFVFVTVDAVTVQSGRLYVTGIKQGDGAPSQEWVNFSSSTSGDSGALESCNRMALLAMTRPGQFLLTIDRSGIAQACKLTRVNP